MAWTVTKEENCKESYSLQVDSDSAEGILYVCLTLDNAVKITYKEDNRYGSIILGGNEEEESNRESVTGINISGNYELQSELLEETILQMTEVLKIIYKNRRHLLEIESGEILKAIYNFATNDIEEMEKEKYN
ncbi:MAG: hypothetical protein KAJ88_04265 [Candidatus Aenigmarchaeota archaeon]|nr:hypothetical protein [Candidatus Aenigmarchaeota archaeon]